MWPFFYVMFIISQKLCSLFVKYCVLFELLHSVAFGIWHDIFMATKLLKQDLTLHRTVFFSFWNKFCCTVFLISTQMFHLFPSKQKLVFANVNCTFIFMLIAHSHL